MDDVSTRKELHKPHLPFLVFLCVTSALGGLVWGFDAIVISGTITSVKTQFGLSPRLEGFFVSSGLLGAVLGSGIAGWLSDRFGRSRNLQLAAILLWLSAWGSAFAGGIWPLILARGIGGLGVGISAMVCPLYLSEISPTHLRGRLVTVFQFAITIGIVIALFNNFGLHQLAQSIRAWVSEGSFLGWFLVDQTWRAMFASELIPGTIFLVMATMLPESPRWLIRVDRFEEAQSVLQRIFRSGAAEEFDTIKRTLLEERNQQGRFVDVFLPQYRRSLIVAVLLSAFAQFSGINVVFYYGTSMLESAGFGSDNALSGMVIIGLVNMICTVIAMKYVDQWGRRWLLQVGTLGAMLCLMGISLTFGTGSNGLLIGLMCGFVAFFAFSLGPIKFIFASEIFPTNIRSHAMSIAILTMWGADTLVGQFTPSLREGLGPSATFLLFACVLTPQFVLVWKLMPETAGRSLEEIERSYDSSSSHLRGGSTG